MSEETPAPCQSKPFDLFASLAAFAQQNQIALNDATLIDRFMADARPRLERALTDAPLVHGSRTERLFEATVLTLGRYRMFKTEDIGRVHSATKARAPDFRAVLDDGEQWLIEVKNMRGEEPLEQTLTMSTAYLGSLQSYADMVGTPLKLAIFWSLWNIWTIVSPERFRREDGGLRVAMQDAVKANEFGKLGETVIMTKPPLRLVLDADRTKPRTLNPEGMTEFMIVGARFYSGDTELIDPRDRRLAQILMLFGDWPVSAPVALMDGDAIGGVEYVSRPEEESDQGFDGIGWASRIFSRYYATQTLDGDQVIQLNGEAVPDWFAPLGDWDFRNSKLPLWLGHVQPNSERNGTEADVH